MRDSLLEQVDEIIQRQNGVDPLAKIETFQVETAARRVLKALLENFVDIQKGQNNKIKEYTSKIDSNTRRIADMEQ
jgi:hypothetical protein